MSQRGPTMSKAELDARTRRIDRAFQHPTVVTWKFGERFSFSKEMSMWMFPAVDASSCRFVVPLLLCPLPDCRDTDPLVDARASGLGAYKSEAATRPRDKCHSGLQTARVGSKQARRHVEEGTNGGRCLLEVSSGQMWWQKNEVPSSGNH
jgi:hypothetical protein